MNIDRRALLRTLRFAPALLLPRSALSSDLVQTGTVVVAGGAARGAVMGAIGGAIAGYAGEGAAIGAGVGAAAGLTRRNRERRQEAQINDQAMAQYQADLGRYNQAFAACIEGRGYVIR
jgi:hypothetical protein